MNVWLSWVVLIKHLEIFRQNPEALVKLETTTRCYYDSSEKLWRPVFYYSYPHYERET